MTAGRPASPDRAADLVAVAAAQRRTVSTLVGSQITAGVGISSGFAVAALAAESLSGSAQLSGLGQTASVLGSALAAVPIARLMAARGRRPGLATGYLIAAVGALICIISADLGLFWPFVAGMFLYGLAVTANLQARYAATDLATPATRARSLAVVVWATTVGVVIGPNLIEPGAAVARRLGLPELVGPYVFAVAGFLLGALIVSVRLRPDPLLMSRAGDAAATAASAARLATGSVLALIARTPAAFTSVAAMATAHTAMVAVMSMTPIHLHAGGASLSVVGLVISLHVAGMYALSPVVGWLADRIGRRFVIVAGQLLIVASSVIAGTAPAHDGAGQVGVGLTLLGLGWSCSLVAGSTLLTESVELAVRPAVQGVADFVMGLSAAGGAALSGLVIGVWGYGSLNGLAASLVVVPLVIIALRVRRPGEGPGVSA